MLKQLLLMGAGIFSGSMIVIAEVKEGAGHEYDNIKLVQKAEVKDVVLPAVMSVDFRRVIRRCDIGLFGLSFDNLGNDVAKIYSVTPGQPYPTISPEWVKAAQGLKFPFNRVFIRDDHWLMSIGPMADRKPHKRVSWDSKGAVQVCGPIELIKALRQIDPAAQFNITLDLTDKTPAQVRDLAEFLMGDAQTVWGRKRIEYGLSEPVIPLQWELGNERDWSDGKITAETYVRLSKAVIAEVRKVQPDARFTACAATAPWHETQSKGWRAWNQTILKELGKDIVSLSFHPYYHGYPLSLIETYMARMNEDIANSPYPNVKIFISEYGKWPGGKPGRWENSWYLTHALTGCLDAAEWMTRMLYHPEVDYMTMHAFSSGPWGMFYADEYSGRPYGTALADLFRFYRMLPSGGEVIECKLSGAETNPADGKMSYSGSAIKSGNKLYMLLVNRLPGTARETQITLPGWKLSAHHCLTGPDIEAVNTAADRPIQILDLKPSTDKGNVNIPARSVNILVWEKV